ncbi:MAG: XRE family transcriptional regulator [Lachnospiraceae bacterium]|nr:XRE family transcriptional regulator [Lachnospiraceae bacterium]
MSENLTFFNGERLKSARLFNKMTISELAENVAVSKQAISQYETNKSEPKLEVLLKLISALGFPREYFYQSDKKKMAFGDTYFRSLAATSNKERMAQIERVRLFANIVNTIGEYIEFPSLSLYELKDSEEIDVEALARNVRQSWGIPENQPIHNIIDEMERHGIIVTDVFTDSAKIDAYSQVMQIEKTPMAIVILGTDKENAFRRNFSAAHELGHILLDDYFNVNDLSKLEYKEMEDTMHRFAGALLIPREAYTNDLMTTSKVDLNLYIQLKRKYHVSAAALIVRAKNLDIITQNQYQYLMKQLSQKGYRTAEPFDKETPLIKPRYIKQAMKMIIEEDGVTGSEFLNTLQGNNVTLSSGLVENILNLPKGYLNQNDDEKEVISLQRK